MSVFEGMTHAELQSHEATLARFLEETPKECLVSRLGWESALKEVRRRLALPEEAPAKPQLTGAGPWIRVDSGERPENGEMVLLAWLTYGDERRIVRATYLANIDCVHDDGADGGMMSMFDWFARIRPPEER